METVALAAAILFLAPTNTAEAAERYADSIIEHSRNHGVDPLLVVALIHAETGGTWDAKIVGKTRDYGLMQIHVSKTTNPALLGQESLLFCPDTNIRVGVEVLSGWKRYHRRCAHQDHPWWAHYKWGREVKNSRYSLRVLGIYKRLKSSERTRRICLSGTTHDHRCRGMRRLREKYPDTLASEGVAGNSDIVPSVLWALWTSDTPAPERDSRLPTENTYGEWRNVGIVSRRRFGVAGFDDRGQV